MFIEEPVLCENMEVFKEIAVACNIPIARERGSLLNMISRDFCKLVV